MAGRDHVAGGHGYPAPLKETGLRRIGGSPSRQRFACGLTRSGWLPWGQAGGGAGDQR
jgi:hypothetical protein